MKRVIMMLSASGFVLALAMASWAQVKVLPTQTVTVDGTVETIDYPKRVVTIKTTTGEFHDVRCARGRAAIQRDQGRGQGAGEV